jgi:hypothetical protein
VRQVVVHVVDARRLAAATMPSVIQRDVDDFGSFENVSRYPERFCQAMRFDGDGEFQFRHQ